MKHFFHVLFVCLFSAAAVFAQNQTSSTAASASSNPEQSRSASRGPVFRATKEQVVAAQNFLRSKGAYTGEASGKLDPDTRASIKSYQKENGLAATGTLNRATLEKMGIALNDKQKAIPIPASSYAKAGSGTDGDKPRRAVFRATKDQVAEAQRLLKAGGMYAGEESGKLDDPTREGLKKYQEANGLKVTGTLNQVTLEKMGIELTQSQKAGGGTK